MRGHPPLLPGVERRSDQRFPVWSGSVVCSVGPYFRVWCPGVGPGSQSVSQSVLYYRNYVYDIRMITKADLPLIRDLLCYLISNRCTCYEDFSIYVMWLSSVNYF